MPLQSRAPKSLPTTIPQHNNNRYELRHDTVLAICEPTRVIMIGWMCMRRSPCLFLLICSPILLPFICVAELCFRLFGQRKKDGQDVPEEEERLRLCEEGLCGSDWTMGDEGDEVGALLQRYLDDQLRLAEIIYECGGDDDGEELAVKI